MLTDTEARAKVEAILLEKGKHIAGGPRDSRGAHADERLRLDLLLRLSTAY